MKKKISLIVLLLLVASRIFARGYSYFDDHKKSSSGQVSVHVKVCFPKNSNADIEGNAKTDLRGLVNSALELEDRLTLSLTSNITEVVLPNRLVYRIVMNEFSSGYCCVTVYKGYSYKGSVLEKIYEDTSYSYNYMYGIYQTQCNKYLEYIAN